MRNDDPEGQPSVDHLDGNPNNNRLENLVWCSQSQNIAKSRGWGGRSLPKNVYVSGTRYRVQIVKDRKAYHFGVYATIDGAAEAAKAARMQLHGV